MEKVTKETIFEEGKIYFLKFADGRFEIGRRYRGDFIYPYLCAPDEDAKIGYGFNEDGTLYYRCPISEYCPIEKLSEMVALYQEKEVEK